MANEDAISERRDFSSITYDLWDLSLPWLSSPCFCTLMPPAHIGMYNRPRGLCFFNSCCHRAHFQSNRVTRICSSTLVGVLFISVGYSRYRRVSGGAFVAHFVSKLVVASSARIMTESYIRALMTHSRTMARSFFYVLLRRIRFPIIGEIGIALLTWNTIDGISDDFDRSVPLFRTFGLRRETIIVKSRLLSRRKGEIPRPHSHTTHSNVHERRFDNM